MITYDEIAALDPCWLHDGRADELRSRIGNGVTAMQIATASDVSDVDRRWLLTRLCARTDAGRKTLVSWAAGCAQDVLHTIGNADVYDAACCAISAAVAWVHGAATREDCSAAYDAAYDAAYAAAAYASYADPTLAERHLLDLATAMEVALLRAADAAEGK